MDLKPRNFNWNELIFRCGTIAGCLLFFMMLFVPTSYKSAKIIILGFVLWLILCRIILSGRLILHRHILGITLFMVSVGALFILRGSIRGEPGALRVSTVYVLWPLVFTLLISGATDEKVQLALLRVLVFSTVVIGLYSLSFILHVAGWLPQFLYVELDQGQSLGFYEGFIEFNLYSLSSLLFLVPFLIGTLLTWTNDADAIISRRYLWVALIFGGVTVLLSGRRVLLLVSLLSPVIALAFRIFIPRSKKLACRKKTAQRMACAFLIFIGLGVLLLPYYDFSMKTAMENFTQGFDFEGDESAYARKEQYSALIEAWKRNPIFGAGHGAAAPGSLRSEEMPWAYELSYIALLFQTGIVGFLAYASGIAWLFIIGLRMISSGDKLGLFMLPVLVGTSCFLIGNATNPYLGKFDYMWVIFLPLVLINRWLLYRNG